MFSSAFPKKSDGTPSAIKAYTNARTAITKTIPEITQTIKAIATRKSGKDKGQNVKQEIIQKINACERALLELEAVQKTLTDNQSTVSEDALTKHFQDQVNRIQLSLSDKLIKLNDLVIKTDLSALPNSTLLVNEKIKSIVRNPNSAGAVSEIFPASPLITYRGLRSIAGKNEFAINTAIKYEALQLRATVKQQLPDLKTTLNNFQPRQLTMLGLALSEKSEDEKMEEEINAMPEKRKMTAEEEYASLHKEMTEDTAKQQPWVRAKSPAESQKEQEQLQARLNRLKSDVPLETETKSQATVEETKTEVVDESSVMIELSNKFLEASHLIGEISIFSSQFDEEMQGKITLQLEDMAHKIQALDDQSAEIDDQRIELIAQRDVALSEERHEDVKNLTTQINLLENELIAIGTDVDDLMQDKLAKLITSRHIHEINASSQDLNAEIAKLNQFLTTLDPQSVSSKSLIPYINELKNWFTQPTAQTKLSELSTSLESDNPVSTTVAISYLKALLPQLSTAYVKTIKQIEDVINSNEPLTQEMSAWINNTLPAIYSPLAEMNHYVADLTNTLVSSSEETNKEKMQPLMDRLETVKEKANARKEAANNLLNSLPLDILTDNAAIKERIRAFETEIGKDKNISNEILRIVSELQSDPSKLTEAPVAAIEGNFNNLAQFKLLSPESLNYETNPSIYEKELQDEERESYQARLTRIIESSKLNTENLSDKMGSLSSENFPKYEDRLLNISENARSITQKADALYHSSLTLSDLSQLKINVESLENEFQNFSEKSSQLDSAIVDTLNRQKYGRSSIEPSGKGSTETGGTLGTTETPSFFDDFNILDISDIPDTDKTLGTSDDLIPKTSNYARIPASLKKGGGGGIPTPSVNETDPKQKALDAITQLENQIETLRASMATLAKIPEVTAFTLSRKELITFVKNLERFYGNKEIVDNVALIDLEVNLKNMTITDDQLSDCEEVLRSALNALVQNPDWYFDGLNHSIEPYVYAINNYEPGNYEPGNIAFSIDIWTDEVTNAQNAIQSLQLLKMQSPSFTTEIPEKKNKGEGEPEDKQRALELRQIERRLQAVEERMQTKEKDAKTLYGGIGRLVDNADASEGFNKLLKQANEIERKINLLRNDILPRISIRDESGSVSLTRAKESTRLIEIEYAAFSGNLAGLTANVTDALITQLNGGNPDVTSDGLGTGSHPAGSPGTPTPSTSPLSGDLSPTGHYGSIPRTSPTGGGGTGSHPAGSPGTPTPSTSPLSGGLSPTGGSIPRTSPTGGGGGGGGRPPSAPIIPSGPRPSAPAFADKTADIRNARDAFNTLNTDINTLKASATDIANAPIIREFGQTRDELKAFTDMLINFHSDNYPILGQTLLDIQTELADRTIADAALPHTLAIYESALWDTLNRMTVGTAYANDVDNYYGTDLLNYANDLHTLNNQNTTNGGLTVAEEQTLENTSDGIVNLTNAIAERQVAALQLQELRTARLSFMARAQIRNYLVDADTLTANVDALKTKAQSIAAMPVSKFNQKRVDLHTFAQNIERLLDSTTIQITVRAAPGGGAAPAPQALNVISTDLNSARVIAPDELERIEEGLWNALKTHTLGRSFADWFERNVPEARQIQRDERLINDLNTALGVRDLTDREYLDLQDAHDRIVANTATIQTRKAAADALETLAVKRATMPSITAAYTRITKLQKDLQTSNDLVNNLVNTLRPAAQPLTVEELKAKATLLENLITPGRVVPPTDVTFLGIYNTLQPVKTGIFATPYAGDSRTDEGTLNSLMQQALVYIDHKQKNLLPQLNTDVDHVKDYNDFVRGWNGHPVRALNEGELRDFYQIVDRMNAYEREPLQATTVSQLVKAFSAPHELRATRKKELENLAQIGANEILIPLLAGGISKDESDRIETIFSKANSLLAGAEQSKDLKTILDKIQLTISGYINDLKADYAADPATLASLDRYERKFNVIMASLYLQQDMVASVTEISRVIDIVGGDYSGTINAELGRVFPGGPAPAPFSDISVHVRNQPTPSLSPNQLHWNQFGGGSAENQTVFAERQPSVEEYHSDVVHLPENLQLAYQWTQKPEISNFLNQEFQRRQLIDPTVTREVVRRDAQVFFQKVINQMISQRVEINKKTIKTYLDLEIGLQNQYAPLSKLTDALYNQYKTKMMTPKSKLIKYEDIPAKESLLLAMKQMEQMRHTLGGAASVPIHINKSYDRTYSVAFLMVAVKAGLESTDVIDHVFGVTAAHNAPKILEKGRLDALGILIQNDPELKETFDKIKIRKEGEEIAVEEGILPPPSSSSSMSPRT